jgi:dipeptidyl aminopeptidase/acylaminoacyl peptidase
VTAGLRCPSFRLYSAAKSERRRSLLRKFRMIACALMLSSTCALAQEPAKKSGDLAANVAKMARIGRASSASFSPDGKRVAFVSDLNGIPQIWIVPSEGGYPLLVTMGNDPVTTVRWSPADENSLAFSLAPGGGMNTQICLVRPDGTALRRLTPGGKDNNSFGGWTHDGRLLMMGSNMRDAAAIDPYLVDPVSGKADLLQQGQGINAVEDVSRDGKYALISRLVSRGNNDLYLLDLQTHREVLLTAHEGPGQFSGEIASDGRTVYLASNKDRDLTAFGRVRLDQSNKPGPIEVLAERKDAELDGFQLNEQGTLAALVWNVGGKNELAMAELPSAKSIRGAELPAELVSGLTFSEDGRQLAMTITGARSPADIWVMDVASQKLRQLTFSPHAAVELSHLVRPELVKFKAHDGLELSGWLYRPVGQHAPASYVLSFHGGPEAQERPAFRSDYQALLSQGIGVFAPNVRGSSGFGKRFVNLDNGALRVNGVKDIKSCVDYLVSNGIAGPKRIGITGGSYGGYMTMAGVTEFPDSFAAGVDLFGIVNFATFFKHTEPWMAAISTVEYGDPATQADMLKSLSPIYKLDRIKAAMMVQHGANDTNVPVIEAEQIVKSLKDRGVPVEYVLFPDEGHGFRKTPNRIKSTVTMVEFFAKYLGTGETAAAQPNQQ